MFVAIIKLKIKKDKDILSESQLSLSQLISLQLVFPVSGEKSKHVNKYKTNKVCVKGMKQNFLGHKIEL